MTDVINPTASQMRATNALTAQVRRIADHLEKAAETSLRDQLATLIDRWQEVADAYKPDDMGGEWDDTTRRYQHYRHTYQRTIRDLRTVLDAGRIPCALMTNAERANGDCGQVHDAEPPTP